MALLYPQSGGRAPSVSRNTRYTLLTLVKGLAALEALEAVDGGLTLTELARRLKESQTVVFRSSRPSKNTATSGTTPSPGGTPSVSASGSSAPGSSAERGWSRRRVRCSSG
ncbi:MAG: hypothetical protein DME04_05630 [Candidatus Rokuibacteriota bacterium]|nr:MAG: hypothetical protein DME04_05630 [Candidatus Rokubacteria bacterium]